MAITTWLKMVSREEIEILEANPSSINKLNKKKEESCSTYFQNCINYFLTGDAFPDSSENPLGGLLSGFTSVETEILENGEVGIVRPDEINQLVLELTKVDLNEVKRNVQDADSDELEEQEVYDWEILADEDENPAEVLVSDIQKLIKFYKRADKNGLGVVIYTA